jgi:hypothetical protein
VSQQAMVVMLVLMSRFARHPSAAKKSPGGALPQTNNTF